MKILWLSRHDMTLDQKKDLERIYGEVEIKKVSETVNSYKEILEYGADCEILAVVLPPTILMDLIKNTTKPVIRSISNRVETGNMVLNPATGTMEKEYKFVHGGWEQIEKIEIITKRL